MIIGFQVGNQYVRLTPDENCIHAVIAEDAAMAVPVQYFTLESQDFRLLDHAPEGAQDRVWGITFARELLVHPQSPRIIQNGTYVLFGVVIAGMFGTVFFGPVRSLAYQANPGEAWNMVNEVPF